MAENLLPPGPMTPNKPVVQNSPLATAVGSVNPAPTPVPGGDWNNQAPGSPFAGDPNPNYNQDVMKEHGKHPLQPMEQKKPDEVAPLGHDPIIYHMMNDTSLPLDKRNAFGDMYDTAYQKELDNGGDGSIATQQAREALLAKHPEWRGMRESSVVSEENLGSSNPIAEAGRGVVKTASDIGSGAWEGAKTATGGVGKVLGGIEQVGESISPFGSATDEQRSAQRAQAQENIGGGLIDIGTGGLGAAFSVPSGIASNIPGVGTLANEGFGAIHKDFVAPAAQKMMEVMGIDPNSQQGQDFQHGIHTLVDLASARVLEGTPAGKAVKEKIKAPIEKGASYVGNAVAENAMNHATKFNPTETSKLSDLAKETGSNNVNEYMLKKGIGDKGMTPDQMIEQTYKLHGDVYKGVKPELLASIPDKVPNVYNDSVAHPNTGNLLDLVEKGYKKKMGVGTAEKIARLEELKKKTILSATDLNDIRELADNQLSPKDFANDTAGTRGVRDVLQNIRDQLGTMDKTGQLSRMNGEIRTLSQIAETLKKSKNRPAKALIGSYELPAWALGLEKVAGSHPEIAAALGGARVAGAAFSKFLSDPVRASKFAHSMKSMEPNPAYSVPGASPVEVK